MNELESGFRLSDLTGLIRRRIWILAVAAAVGAVLGYVVYSSTPSTYSSTARVQVQAITYDASPVGEPVVQDVDPTTEQALVKSDRVTDAAIAELRLDDDHDEVQQRVTVTPKTEAGVSVNSSQTSLVIDISYQASTAEAAQQGATAFADNYLAARAREAAETRSTRINAIDQQLVDVQTRIGEALVTDDSATLDQLRDAQTALNLRRLALQRSNVEAVGRVVRSAPLPASTLSKKALGMGVGVAGLCVVAGLAVALVVDHRDSRGGGRRRVEHLVPSANLRVFPGHRGARGGELNAAIDRLAIDIAGGGTGDTIRSVQLVGLRSEPPVDLAERLSVSLTRAGIPTLFVLAGPSEQVPPGASVISSFGELVSDTAGTGSALRPADDPAAEPTFAPQVAWLRPSGPPEASGLFRRGVVDQLIDRAGKEGFETVVFVAGTPTTHAAAAAIGPWVDRTLIIIDDGAQAIGPTIDALLEADIEISEVVWT